MKVYGLWYGGSSYACPSIYNQADVEKFESIEDAKQTLFSRYANYNGSTPAVTQESNIQLFFFEQGSVREYPDRIIYFGPRGGIRVEKC